MPETKNDGRGLSSAPAGNQLRASDTERTPFGRLLDVLGIEDHEATAVCWAPVGGSFLHRHIAAGDAAEAVAAVAELADVWFNPNPIGRPESGRGSDVDVTRCAALFIDLDVKTGGVSGPDDALAITKTIAEALGQAPAALVATGHGWHAYWALEAEDEAWTLDSDAKRGAAQSIYRRFHRLCAHVAELNGGKVDNVSQLSRILRVPGTFNRKDSTNPIQTTLTEYPFGSSGPLSFEEVADALDAYGVPEVEEDRQPVGAVVSEAAGWAFGEQTSTYVARMVTGWSTDVPTTTTRHNWLVSQATRLACAARVGRISESDYRGAAATLEARFEVLLATCGEPRKPTPGEVAGALAWGVRRTEVLADEQAAEEIGGADQCDAGGGSLNLPESFWAAHPTLGHIRQFAHHGVNSADAVLGAVLARLAAHLDPSVRIDTGIKRPLPLNMFVGIVGSAGTGKSSAYMSAGDLLEFAKVDPLTLNLIAGDELPAERPIGTGPGLAEAFMGNVPDSKNPKAHRRVQVRHKLLLTCDEGAGLVTGILDAKRGQDIGPTLRAAWSGAVIGQANASAERTREVHDYSIGLSVGFQLEALAAMSTAEQLEYGTPQRFVYVAATDPTIPDDAPGDPGPLRLDLPVRPLRYSEALRRQGRREALARARGQVSAESADTDPMLAHRPAMIARLAALLVIVCEPGREEVDEADVALAEVLFATSTRMHEVAMEHRRERESAERERQMQGRISEQIATAAALDGRDAALTRASDRILRYLDEAGGTAEWNGRDGIRKKFKSTERTLADIALDSLRDAGSVDVDGSTVTRRS